MGSWPVQDAKARFSELLETALHEGPQIVTRRGVEAAVLVPIEEWRRINSSRPSLKDLLLAPEGRFDDLIIPRRPLKRRPPVNLK
jgi:antitoxin Phd